MRKITPILTAAFVALAAGVLAAFSGFSLATPWFWVGVSLLLVLYWAVRVGGAREPDQGPRSPRPAAHPPAEFIDDVGPREHR